MASTQQLAKSIVRGSLRPREYEAVLISCAPHTMELAEQVAIECQRAGADPGLWLDTDAVFYGQFKNYPLENLRRVSAHCLGLLEYMNSYVWLGGVRDPSGMARVPRERWAAYNEGEQAHSDKGNEKKTKNVGVGLGLLTRERAKSYAFSFATWKAQMEAAIAVNYRQMESLGKTVTGLLEQPVGVRVTADNGTDLRFRLETRKAHVNDGIIDDEDIAAGNTSVNLPAGDVSIAPEEISARGTIVGDVPIPLQGKLVEGLAFTFEDGRVAQIDGKRNAKLIQDGFAGGTGDKDRLASLTVGLNPKLRPGFLTSSLARGVVTVGIGDNRGLGGTNKASWGFYASVANATLTVGGKTIVDGGKLAV